MALTPRGGNKVVPSGKGYDYSQLVNLRTGEMVTGSAYGLIEWCARNPSKTMVVETIGSFDSGHFIKFTSYIYVKAGTTQSRTFYAGSGQRITGKKRNGNISNHNENKVEVYNFVFTPLSTPIPPESN